MKATIHYDRETFADDVIGWRLEFHPAEAREMPNILTQDDLIGFVKHTYGEDAYIVGLDLWSKDDYVVIELRGYNPPSTTLADIEKIYAAK